MAYVSFTFRYKGPKLHLACSVGQEWSREGGAKS